MVVLPLRKILRMLTRHKLRHQGRPRLPQILLLRKTPIANVNRIIQFLLRYTVVLLVINLGQIHIQLGPTAADLCQTFMEHMIGCVAQVAVADEVELAYGGELALAGGEGVGEVSAGADGFHEKCRLILFHDLFVLIQKSDAIFLPSFYQFLR